MEGPKSLQVSSGEIGWLEPGFVTDFVTHFSLIINIVIIVIYFFKFFTHH